MPSRRTFGRSPCQLNHCGTVNVRPTRVELAALAWRTTRSWAPVSAQGQRGDSARSLRSGLQFVEGVLQVPGGDAARAGDAHADRA